MKRNMGSVDRLVRTIFAIVVLILFLTEVITGVLGLVLLTIAAVLVLTSLFRFCPLYLPFGISTCKKK